MPHGVLIAFRLARMVAEQERVRARVMVFAADSRVVPKTPGITTKHPKSHNPMGANRP